MNTRGLPGADPGYSIVTAACIIQGTFAMKSCNA